MSRTSVAAIIVILLSFAVLIGGCGKAKEAVDTARAVGQAAKLAKDMEDGKATIKTDDGEIEIDSDKDSGTMTIKSKDGEMEITSEGNDEQLKITTKDEEGKETTMTTGANVDLSGLKVTLYPGAETVGGHKQEGPDGSVIMATLKSKDSFDKVAKFYKDKYPDGEKSEMDMGGQKMLSIQIGESPSQRSVTVMKSDDEDTVAITIMQETKKK